MANNCKHVFSILTTAYSVEAEKQKIFARCEKCGLSELMHQYLQDLKSQECDNGS